MGHGETMLADDRHIDLVGEVEDGIHASLRYARLNVCFEEQLQGKARDFDAVERNRVDVDVSFVADAVGMSDDLDLVNAGKNRQQRIGGVDSGANAVKVDPGTAGDHPGLAFESYRFDAVGESELVRCQVRIDLL